MWKIVHQIMLLGGFLLLLLCTSCSHDRKIGLSSDPRLQKSFSGNYKQCQAITIAFGEDDLFACRIHSTESVGHFNDVVWGTYSTDSTHIYLHVEELNEDNLAYKELPVEMADSLIISESGDSLKIYFTDVTGKEEHVLKPGKPITSFTTSGNEDADFKLVLIILFFVIIRIAFVVGVCALIIWGIVELIRKMRKRS